MQAERIPYPHNVEHHGEADGTDCGQEAGSGLRKEKRTPPPPHPPKKTNQKQKQNKQTNKNKKQQQQKTNTPKTKENTELEKPPWKTKLELHNYDVYEEGTNPGGDGRSGICAQQSAIKTAEGTPCAIWRQLEDYKMAHSSTPEKKGCHATRKLH